MQIETAKKLYRAAKRLGYTGPDCDRDSRVTVQKGYSGRGMYGKTTIALVIPSMGYLAMMAAAARMRHADRDAFAEEMLHFSSDSMGRSSIVVY